MREIRHSLVVWWLGIFFLISPASALEPNFAEGEGAVRTWRSADGLPADSVTAIIQTRDRFLWIGTSAGLVRFDGVKFTTVKLGGYSLNGPVGITALCEDAEGYLWVGTQQEGLFQIKQGFVRHFTRAQGLLDDGITSLAAGTEGRVWIGTKSGLNLVVGQDMRSFTMMDGLPDDFVSNVHVARSGAVWITTRAGMCRFLEGKLASYELQTESQGRSPEYLGAYEDRRGNLWAFGDTYLINLAEGKRFNYFRGNEATSVRIWSLCEGRDGRLWIGTSGRGLFCFDDNRFQPIILDELRWPYDVRAICEDHEGNLWLGTSGGGLVQLRPHPVQVVRSGQGLPVGAPTALALDLNGRLHVGLPRGGIYAAEAGRFDRLAGAGGLSVPEFITALVVARDGMVWAGTLGGGVYVLQGERSVQFTTANGLTDNLVLALCLDGDGSVWASTAAATLHRFRTNQLARFDITHGLVRSPVTAMIPAMGGGLWLGTEDGSVLRGERGKFVLVQSGEPYGSRPVLALHETQPGQLWIGTADGGLRCVAGSASAQWTTGNGLPHNYVAGVVADATGNLWISTGAGIYRIAWTMLEKSLADPELPLSGKQIAEAKTMAETSVPTGGLRALAAPEGRLWFATAEGLLNVDTRRPETEVAALPVYIETVSFNAQSPFTVLRGAAWSPERPKQAPLIAPGDLRSLEIQFTAMNFSQPDKTRFRHKLEGFDLDWVDDGAGRVARYGRLPYGQYAFRVAARTAEGNWHEAATKFSFEVPTPIYLRSWAIGFYGIAAVALVAGVVRVVSHRRLRVALAQMEQQQALERERMRIARDMHDEIGSKLTKISFLSEHARVDSAADGPLAGKIESIAETSRDLLQTMDEIVWVVNPRNDTLEHLAAYLSHYADEYFQNTSIECELRLPQAIALHPVSSETRHNLFLAFEETLNNVLKHSGATRVKVEMSVKAQRFEIVVTDNGCGFDSATRASAGPSQGGRGGNGLRNMRQRLSDVGGECVVRSQPGTGTTVTLRIQLQPGPGQKS